MTKLQRKPLVTVGYMGGVPTVPEPFCYSLARMVSFTQEACDFEIALDRAQVSYHSYARNVLAARMQGDWLLMLDTDHEFEPDLLCRLLNTVSQKGIEVLSGLYRYKTPPYQPVAYLWSDKPGKTLPIGSWDHPVFQVDATGGGCLLVHRSVFDRIRNELGEQPFDIRSPWGEDLSFFQRLTQLKIPAYIDTRIEAKHLRWKTVDADDFQADLCVFNEGQERQAA